MLRVILCVIFSLKLLQLHDFQTFRQIPASLLQVYYNVFMPYDVSDVLQYVQDEGCLKCKTFKTCNIWHMECLGCGMWDVYRCVMLTYKMPEARDAHSILHFG